MLVMTVVLMMQSSSVLATGQNNNDFLQAVNSFVVGQPFVMEKYLKESTDRHEHNEKITYKGYINNTQVKVEVLSNGIIDEVEIEVYDNTLRVEDVMSTVANLYGNYSYTNNDKKKLEYKWNYANYQAELEQKYHSGKLLFSVELNR